MSNPDILKAVLPVIITGVLSLGGIIFTARSTRKTAELEANDKRRGSDLEDVRAASAEWKSLYETQREAIKRLEEGQKNLENSLKDTEKRLSNLERLNTVYRSIMARLVSYLKWVEEGGHLDMRNDPAPEELQPLLLEAQSVLNKYDG